MPDYFLKAQAFVNQAEGSANFVVVNGRPVLKGAAVHDKGGPTIYGITIGTLKSAYNAGIVDHADITRLTHEEALTIYKARYWTTCRANLMEWPLCLLHYDTAVNCGNGGAGQILQRAINILITPDIAVDGAVGPNTLAAITKLNLMVLCNKQLECRLDWYDHIIDRNPKQAVFKKGWYNRVDRLRDIVRAN